MDSSSDIIVNGRQKWTKSHEFVFALAGCAIGLGNVWRFPYLCYKYGGGSFMVAYLFFLIIVGVPMLMLEVTIGQFMSRGGIEAWNMVPLFKGIGFASLVIVIYMNIYYIVILAWILNYFVQTIITLFTSGFNGMVPWSTCLNSIRWTAKLAFLNSFASMFAGLAIFSILGHLSYQMGVSIDEVADKGPGLAFIAYPRALSSLEMGPAFWNMMFFLMLFMLGIATQCAAVEGMITTIVDLMPSFFIPTKPVRRQIFVGIGCFSCFILALPMVSRSGVYFFQLMDSYGASGISLMLITILQVVVISWIYGIDRFFEDLKEMCYQSRLLRGVHKKTDPFKAPWLGLKYIWKYATPLSLTVALVYNFTDIKSPTYESRVTGVYEYPAIGCAIAVFLVLSSLMAIPIFALIFVIKRKRNGDSIDFKSLTESILPADHPYMNQRSIVKPIITITDSVESTDDSTRDLIISKIISQA